MRTRPEGEVPAPNGQYVAIYLRTSHKKLDTTRQEPSLRRWSELREWAKARGLRIRWFKDKWSVIPPVRPEWDRLMTELEAQRIAAIACWRLDRLGKTCTELAAFVDDLIARKVNLMSLSEDFDLSTPTGRRMAEVLGSVAAFESEMRTERILAGQAAARARGVRWGGSVKGRRLKVTPQLEAKVRRLRIQGTKIAQIARETGLSRPTVYSVLARIGDPGRVARRRPRRATE
jgi:DNA invertase Pin-like site-specific DNA recombinase